MGGGSTVGSVRFLGGAYITLLGVDASPLVLVLAVKFLDLGPVRGWGLASVEAGKNGTKIR